MTPSALPAAGVWSLAAEGAVLGGRKLSGSR
jgi:hypothetical protein